MAWLRDVRQAFPLRDDRSVHRSGQELDRGQQSRSDARFAIAALDEGTSSGRSSCEERSMRLLAPVAEPVDEECDHAPAAVDAAPSRTRMTSATVVGGRAKQGSAGSVTDLGAMRSRAFAGLQWVLRGQPERNQP